MLYIHILLSVTSLVAHLLFAASQARGTNYVSLRWLTYGSLLAASGSGLLLSDGTARGFAHIVSMLVMFLAVHAIIFGARRHYARDNG